MSKGYNANRERLEQISLLGKTLGKRAKFACEWCQSKDDLRTWDYKPDMEPAEETLALLCGRCRELAEGKQGEITELRAIRNALWSNIPAVAEGAARVLSRAKEPWAREAIEDSFIDQAVKESLLKG